MDWIAFIITIISLYYNAKKNIWCWPLGILSCVFWAIVAFSTGAYALLILQFVLVGMNVYGWRCWHKEKPILSLQPTENQVTS